MIKRSVLTGFAILLISMILVNCKKDNANPTIKFIPDAGFTGRDTMMKVNYSLTITIEVRWNGVDALSQLELKQNGLSIQTYSVGGDSATFKFNIQKGSDATEIWTFIVKDVEGNQSEISLTLTRDPNSEFGEITYYSPVVLGAQNNTVKSGFITFQTLPATLFTLEGAFINQSKIDLMFYSDGVTQ